MFGEFEEWEDSSRTLKPTIISRQSLERMCGPRRHVDKVERLKAYSYSYIISVFLMIFTVINKRNYNVVGPPPQYKDRRIRLGADIMAFSFSIGIESKSHCIQNFEGCLFIDLTISEKLLDSITAHILLIYGNKPQVCSFPDSMLSVSTDVISCFQAKFYNLTTAAGNKEQSTK